MIRIQRLLACSALGLVTLLAPASFLDGPEVASAAAAAAHADRAKAMVGMARSLMAAQPAAALEKLRSAESLAEHGGDQRLLLEVVRLQRDLALQAGDHDRSLKDALRVVDLGQRLHDARSHAGDLIALGDAYKATGAFDLAVETYRKARSLGHMAGDAAAASRAWIATVEALVRTARTADVLEEGRAALAYQEEQGNKPGEATIWRAMGEALTNDQRHADALPHLAKAERIQRDLSAEHGLATTLTITARALVGLGHWQQADRYINEVLGSAEGSEGITPDPVIYQLKSRVLEAEGAPAEALRMERQYAALRDSIQNSMVAARVAGIRALHGSTQQEAELKLLRSAAAEQQELIERARVRGRWWLAAFAAMLLALGCLLMLWNRLRRTAKRAEMRSEVIRRQSEEIKAKNLELERQNLRLAESLMQEEEKDVLLKEIHHRVKNNLQIVITLLRMQGHHQKDDRLEEILADCEGRVRSMALVHEHIYRVGDLRRVNVRAHLLALSEAVLKQYDLDGKVKLDLLVNYDLARFDDLIPLSLIINELLTNSAKHAFSGRDQGRIAISLRKLGENQYELTFADDGVGPQQDAFFRSGSFGLELVRSLATQLDGRIRLLKGEGTTFQMTFQPEERSLRKVS
jgi:two-component sensor histidine kinase/tetratricopeptide (TPR) repeat protein